MHFSSFQDARRLAAKLPYADRPDTVTYIKHATNGGYTLFTGGKISDQETQQILNALKDPNCRQTNALFYDLNQPNALP